MKSTLRRIAASAALVAIVFAAAPALAAADSKGVVNVNSASAAELERLPGIGPALAQRIVAHREKNGAFKKLEDLMLVRGIGEKSFARIQPYVALSGATTLTESIGVPRAARTQKPQE
jgi:comEA protein